LVEKGSHTFLVVLGLDAIRLGKDLAIEFRIAPQIQGATHCSFGEGQGDWVAIAELRRQGVDFIVELFSANNAMDQAKRQGLVDFDLGAGFFVTVRVKRPRKH